jgi:hypothetical protein
MFFAAGTSTLAGFITLLSSVSAAFRPDAASETPFSGRPAPTSPFASVVVSPFASVVVSPFASVASSSGGARR